MALKRASQQQSWPIIPNSNRMTSLPCMLTPLNWRRRAKSPEDEGAVRRRFNDKLELWIGLFAVPSTGMQESLAGSGALGAHACRLPHCSSISTKVRPSTSS